MSLTKKQILKNIITHSLALGVSYIAWLLLYTQLLVTETHVVPVAFFNVQSNEDILAPEEISCTCKASRAILDRTSLAVYIDASRIPAEQPHLYQVQTKDLFVPDAIDMVHCYPSVISITKKRLDTA